MATVEITLPKPYPWQREIIESKKQNIAICAARQIGKTHCARSLAAREALRGGSVLWAAPTARQTGKNYESLKKMLKPVREKAVHSDTIRLTTRGMIDFRSTTEVDNLRGDNYSLIILDEAAFMDEEVMAVIEPMLLKSNGRLVMISTPNGYNWFQSLFMKAMKDETWDTRQLTWEACPDYTEEKIKARTVGMSDGKFKAEYEAKFTNSALSIFKPEWLGESIWVDAVPDGIQRHAIAIDLSLGRLRSDWQAIVYVAFKDGTLYAECYADRMPVPDLLVKAKSLYEAKRPEGVAIETNAFQALAKDAFLNLFDVPPVIWEIHNQVNKEIRITRLTTLLAEGRLKLVRNAGGQEAFREFADYPSPEQHDDVIDAIEQGWRALASGK